MRRANDVIARESSECNGAAGGGLLYTGSDNTPCHSKQTKEHVPKVLEARCDDLPVSSVIVGVKYLRGAGFGLRECADMSN
jgi:hypothetical protein